MTDNGDVSAKPGASVDRPGGGSGAGQPETGGGAADGPEVKTPEFDYSNADLSIRPGAGLYEQFQKLDIPQSEWSDLLNKVGPELHDVQAGGHAFSYKMPNGEWGIRMTSDGMMPRSAADKIMAAHQELAGTGSTASEVAATPSVETSAPSSVSVEKTGLADGASAPATVENLNAPVNQGALQSIMKHETIGVGDINNSSEFTELSHVASWYPPERIAEKLGLANADWNNLQEYIIQQTNSGDRLYRDVFEVRKGGYLGFTGNRIPSDTMADMLNHVPASVRYRLAA
jgi:hypothetical protein